MNKERHAYLNWLSAKEWWKEQRREWKHSQQNGDLKEDNKELWGGMGENKKLTMRYMKREYDLIHKRVSKNTSFR